MGKVFVVLGGILITAGLSYGEDRFSWLRRAPIKSKQDVVTSQQDLVKKASGPWKISNTNSRARTVSISNKSQPKANQPKKSPVKPKQVVTTDAKLEAYIAKLEKGLASLEAGGNATAAKKTTAVKPQSTAATATLQSLQATDSKVLTSEFGEKGVELTAEKAEAYLNKLKATLETQN